VSRIDYYRRPKDIAGSDADLDLREKIQAVALQMSASAYRRVTAELGRRGEVANHKRVLRLMREDNLLCLRKRKFIGTSDWNHSLTIYPNLAGEMSLSRIDQLWVSDITNIRLLREFIYQAVILDAYSRRCIGWALGQTLQSSLAAEALTMGLSSRTVGPGLVHHSDRGVQYASREYTDLLKEQGILISMSRRANPYDNAKAESFMKRLKMEEVYLYEYEKVVEAKRWIEYFQEDV
jgi:putative transposase